jgi:hypothetical protein
MLQMKDNKYPIGGYAPGDYLCFCVNCENPFKGDKRAVQCEPCAIEMVNTKVEVNDKGCVGIVKQNTLEEEAREHAHLKEGFDEAEELYYNISGMNAYYSYQAGATSKYVQRQRIEAIIWTLEELRNIDTVKYIDPKIDELQEQLKILENE